MSGKDLSFVFNEVTQQLHFKCGQAVLFLTDIDFKGMKVDSDFTELVDFDCRQIVGRTDRPGVGQNRAIAL